MPMTEHLIMAAQARSWPANRWPVLFVGPATATSTVDALW